MASFDLLGEVPEAKWYTADAVPPGFWQRNERQIRPVSPLYADFKVARHFPGATHAADEEFSTLTPTRESIVIDGYVYGGSSVPDAAPSQQRIEAFEQKVLNRHDLKVIARWPGLKPRAIAEMLEVQKQRLDVLNDEELSQHVQTLDDKLADWYSVHFIGNRAAPLSIGRCALFCNRHFGLDAAQFLELMAGSSLASQAPARYLQIAARRLLRHPDLFATVETEGAFFDSRIQAFLRPYLERYAYRSPEFEYIYPTPAEMPARVMDLLGDAIAKVTGGRDAHQEARGARELGTKLRAQLGEHALREQMDTLLRDARTAYGLREDDIGICLWGEGLMRHAFLEVGRRLVAKSVFKDAEEVFYLRRKEAMSALLSQGGHEMLQSIAVKRRRDREQQMVTTPPSSFGEPMPRQSLRLTPEAEEAMKALDWFTLLGARAQAPEAVEPKVLRGTAASKGQYVGRARLVLDEADFDKVLPGDVLVCPLTSPSWSVLFNRIGAIVTDTGGVLAHPAIIAREFGIPAVVATRRATKTFVDDDLIEVDGTAGVARLVTEAAPG